ncbi:unnamed protein product [Closterium sp. Yama58-4]|nr:unnamed protein product [Closterium sp. Yama58-4]
MAGFSGDPGDYYIGRAHAELPDDKEWKDLQNLFKKHIYSWLEEELAKVEAYNEGKKSHGQKLSAEQFLKALRDHGRDVVAQDLAMYWIFCENPNVLTHMLQDTINRLKGTHQNMKLRLLNQELMDNAGTMKAEMAELRMENKSLREENALLREALQRALGGDESPPCAAANGGTAGAKREDDAETPQVKETPQQKEQRMFFEAVVDPWLKSKKVSEAWKMWDRGTALMGGSSIRDLAKGGDFLATFSKFGDPNLLENSCSKRLGRRRNQMLTIDNLRPPT